MTTERISKLGYPLNAEVMDRALDLAKRMEKEGFDDATVENLLIAIQSTPALYTYYRATQPVINLAHAWLSYKSEQKADAA